MKNLYTILKTTLLVAVLTIAAVSAVPTTAQADIVIECGGSGDTCIINIGSPLDGEYELLDIFIE